MVSDLVLHLVLYLVPNLVPDSVSSWFFPLGSSPEFLVVGSWYPTWFSLGPLLGSRVVPHLGSSPWLTLGSSLLFTHGTLFNLGSLLGSRLVLHLGSLSRFFTLV